LTTNNWLPSGDMASGRNCSELNVVKFCAMEAVASNKLASEISMRLYEWRIYIILSAKACTDLWTYSDP
jgi:hypothetical protein